MKLLDGQQVAGFIKNRQFEAVKSLRRAGHQPGLAILSTGQNPVIETYIGLKKRWGDDIGVKTSVQPAPQNELPELIKNQNQDPKINGVILQLPLADPSQTDQLCRLIDPQKDVDGLNPDSSFDSATATAVNWLLASYNIDLANKSLVIIGQGRLVGKPLAEIWRGAELKVEVMDEDNLSWERVAQADVVVSATGRPGLLKAQHLGPGAVVVDAGTHSQAGRLVGDVDPGVYQSRDDLTITPPRGGLGPMTVAALFENLIVAAQKAG